MNPRVTQSDIARVAGVHNTTVSLALRNSPAIPELTRKRIQAIAEEMGYAPDPALQALVAYRNARMPNRRQETLAYVTGWHTKWGWQDEPLHAKYHAGAQRKAAENGFQLEHFWLGEPGMTQRRLNNVLFHRGITGVVLASHRPDSEPLLDLDWTRLSTVKIGCFPQSPSLDRVVPDASGTVREAIKRIAMAGYERVGFVMPQWWDDWADQAWSSSILAAQSRIGHAQRVPLLLYGRPAGDLTWATEPRVVGLRTLETWLVRHEPDVIASFGSFVRGQLDVLAVNVPRDVAYVDLSLEGSDAVTTGFTENCERVGEVALEILITKLRQNTRGLPGVATTTLVEGRWQEGGSMPANGPATSWTGAAAHSYSDTALVTAP